MTVGIIGLGLIGGSLAKAFQRDESVTVLGWDADHSIVEFAEIAQAIDGELTDDKLKGLDLLLLATYPEAVVEHMTRLAPLLDKSTLVIDCAGTKEKVCASVFPLAKQYGFSFLGGHPMAGTHFSGFKYSRADLFDGAPMVLVPPAFDDIRLLDRAKKLLEPVGFALAEGEQEASGQLTASVMMHLHAWRPCQLQYVADAFSTQFETAVTPQELAAEDLACMLNETASSTASGPLPDADAQLRACFVSYGPAQVTPYRDGWAFTVRAVATAFAENSLAELESYEKTLELVFPLAVEAPPGAQFSPECWLSTENIQCSCTGGTLEVTVTARAEGAILCRSTHPGIGSIELGEPLTTPDPEIALRIYYAQAGEELFGIARRFHVSPAQILTANGLEAGTQVLPQAMHFLVPGA